MIRGLTVALACALLLGGCTATDDFSSFHFDGGVDRAADLAITPGAFGAACTQNSCKSGLTCATQFPNGMCVRGCMRGTPDACGTLDADCVDVGLSNNAGLCLPRCQVGGVCARATEGYACCKDGQLAGTTGTCAPLPSKVCSH